MTSFSTTLNEEFPHLKNKIYVDYAGAMVMCKSQIRVLAELTEGCHSNPHSSGQISQPVSDLEDLRSVICKTLGTTPGKYAVVFTQNASHAIHIVGELFKWNEKTKYSYLFDNHNSIFGLRFYAEEGKSKVECVSDFPEVDENYETNVFAYQIQ